MKINKYIMIGSLILTAAIAFNSCENALDVPPSKELEGTYFETENRVQRSVGAIYAKLTDIYGAQLNQGGTPATFAMLAADDITFDGTGSSYETFSGLNAGDGRIGRMWERLYQIVARANFVLAKIEEPEIQAVYTTEGLKDINRGEALFLRSWAFYKLWDFFRKAPIQDERITSIENTTLPPSEGFEMLDNAISSLEEAANLLPDSWDAANLGRVTKNSAYGLLVKCYVLRACYSRDNADYTKAIAAFENISGDAQLVASFGDNFDYRTENNSESLFEWQASHAPAQDNAWLDNDFGGAVGQMGAFYHMWDGHWGNYMTGIYGPTQKLINAFEPGDPRLDETLSNNADNLGWSLWWITPQWDKFNGYQMVKYTHSERGNCYDNTWQISSKNNPRLIRLADVKLCAAEAYLQTGNANEALQQVNDIRTRARNSVEPASLVPADLGSVDMQAIMDERFRELAGEDGHRWTDLRRWHAAGYIDLSSWTAADFGFPSQYDPSLFAFEVPKNLLYPIPTSELDKNPNMALSGNNPGY
ncbi:MAG: RagB/SusD family nutrient uptake outer membrane protein [Bacteroidales bacterium]